MKEKQINTTKTQKQLNFCSYFLPFIRFKKIQRLKFFYTILLKFLKKHLVWIIY